MFCFKNIGFWIISALISAGTAGVVSSFLTQKYLDSARAKFSDFPRSAPAQDSEIFAELSNNAPVFFSEKETEFWQNYQTSESDPNVPKLK